MGGGRHIRMCRLHLCRCCVVSVFCFVSSFFSGGGGGIQGATRLAWTCLTLFKPPQSAKTTPGWYAGKSTMVRRVVHSMHRLRYHSNYVCTHRVCYRRSPPPPPLLSPLRRHRPALTFMHDRHIAHADMSCENVLVIASSKHVKVIDFGTHAPTPVPACSHNFNPRHPWVGVTVITPRPGAPRAPIVEHVDALHPCTACPSPARRPAVCRGWWARARACLRTQVPR